MLQPGPFASASGVDSPLALNMKRPNLRGFSLQGKSLLPGPRALSVDLLWVGGYAVDSRSGHGMVLVPAVTVVLCVHVVNSTNLLRTVAFGTLTFISSTQIVSTRSGRTRPGP